MAAKSQSLEVTPTWAVAVVCFVLVAISIIIEHIIHWIGKWLTKNHKGALYEALEKIKSELMLLGFISLLLTALQGPISEICISKALGATWHPCDKREEEKKYGKDKVKLESSGRRGLLTFQDYSENHERVLAAVGYNKCAEKGKVPFVSAYGIHQLHIFIFILALFHVLYCIVTLASGQAKMRKWEAWEIETRTAEYQAAHDPERFRLTRDTSFGRRHLSFWSRSPILLWIVCFFRQFVRSIHKVDYLTLRYGFINAHLRSQSNFNFLNYIKKSLEEDFKVVVGISPVIWLSAVVFLLFNTHGWHSYMWLPFIPLIIILLVGTKLQVIITKMGVRIQERGKVVKGTPVVQLGDDLFWFNHPQLLLYIIHFVLFQNAFQLAFFAWTWYEFGLRTCFHEKTEDIAIRISMGILVQIVCSYVTLPLYALVTQMGSTMKPTILNEGVAKALKSWYRTAHKQVKESSHAGSARSSYPTTPTHGTSPIHLLRYYRNKIDSVHTSPRKSNCDTRPWKTEGPGPSTAPPYPDDETLSDDPRSHDQARSERKGPKQNIDDQPSQSHLFQHEIQLTDFSFDKRSRV